MRGHRLLRPESDFPGCKFLQGKDIGVLLYQADHGICIGAPQRRFADITRTPTPDSDALRTYHGSCTATAAIVTEAAADVRNQLLCSAKTIRDSGAPSIKYRAS